MSKLKLWIKMIVAGGVVSLGGPALIYWVSPSEDELLKRYNPDLRKRALEGRKDREEEFEAFVVKLKELSQSDRPIWEAAAIDEARQKEKLQDVAQKKAATMEEQQRIAADIQKRRDEIRQQSLKSQQ